MLTQPAATRWSGIAFDPDMPLDRLWLWLTGTEQGTCRLAAKPEAGNTRIWAPTCPTRNPTFVEDTSLAYLTWRPAEQTTLGPAWELGVIGHGPLGDQLAERFCTHLQRWGSDPTAQPVITAYPAGTPDGYMRQGLVIDKHHTRLAITLR